MNVNQIKQIAVPILEKYGVNRASLFGSYVRGEQNDKSDIDFLIDPPKGMTLFKLTEMQIDLKKALNSIIDIVTYRSIHPMLKKTY